MQEVDVSPDCHKNRTQHPVQPSWAVPELRWSRDTCVKTRALICPEVYGNSSILSSEKGGVLNGMNPQPAQGILNVPASPDRGRWWYDPDFA